jgi:hypothetical protein
LLNARDAACLLFKLMKKQIILQKDSSSNTPETLIFLLCRSCHNALLDFQAPPKAELGPVLGHVLAAGDAKHPHLGIVPQACEQLGRDEEVLARVLATSNFDHTFVDHAFVAGVHALVDLVDDTEGRLGHGLEGHEEEYGGDGAFATGLAMSIELLEGLVFSIQILISMLKPQHVTGKKERKDLPEFDHNVQSPLVKIFSFVNANLTSTANLLKVVGESVVHLGY